MQVMISSSPIKKEIKDLTLEQLKSKKEAILNFTLAFPDDKRIDHAWKTLAVVNEMIEAKETKDKLKENALKELFF